MIVRRHRFHGYGSLKPVYLRGQSVRGGPLNLKYLSRDPRRPYRVAVVVSRKVHKSAVVRNRIRRRVYEIIRRADAAIAPGSDLVFTAYDEQLANMDAAKLEALINNLLKKTVQN
jgi:ribonuclease P protein component